MKSRKIGGKYRIERGLEHIEIVWKMLWKRQREKEREREGEREKERDERAKKQTHKY